ncbi:MAG: NAD(P)/FAD-dependent oxidoreductase [Chitinophagaceae bacterium]
MLQTDVLVIGAGPSGSIAASILKNKGHQVTIVEKLKFPRFVIGESLLPRCMDALAEADMLEAVKAKGFQEKFGAKFIQDDGSTCDFNFTENFTKGYTYTWQVPRAEFDLTLAEVCEKKGIPVLYETEVVDIKFQDDESSITTIKDKEGNIKTIQAKFIIDGSGYGRVIPRLFNLDKPSTLPTRQALFTHIHDKNRKNIPTEANRIIVYIFNKDTWVWCIPFSNGNTSVGFVGFPDFFENSPGQSLNEKLSYLITQHDALKARFQDCPFVMDSMELKAWSTTTDKFYGKGFVLTGNVTEFLDPIFSSGVTLASVSAQLAANLVNRKLLGEDINWESEYMQPSMLAVDVFRTFVESWYNGDLHTIFFSQNQSDEMRRQICSILAGYVWDTNNPFVQKREKQIKTLSKYIKHFQDQS